ncbi:hypothetical protein [Caballeronia fortuita]|uniref:hypothetical protein n=1 Tax=Caballeronia fortuita TaxID=1777138 RepID=UPI0012FDC6FB|nr:hypothetical protein [Caballeronia fortuita]
MKQELLVNIILVFMAFAHAVGYAKEEGRPALSDFAAHPYGGEVKIPSYYKKGDDGWRDNLGKSVEAPHVNLAASYFVAVHSCGASCGYFTLSDLRTGQDAAALENCVRRWDKDGLRAPCRISPCGMKASGAAV